MITFWKRRRKEVWAEWEWKPKLWSKSRQLFSLNNQSLTRSWLLDWRDCFGQTNKHGRSSGVCTLGLAFGGFTLWPSKLRGSGSSWPKVWTLGLNFGGLTLCLAEGFNYYILLAIFNPFLWTLNKVWPLNPTASWYQQPPCQVALR
jgi:hypothetical protein